MTVHHYYFQFTTKHCACLRCISHCNGSHAHFMLALLQSISNCSCCGQKSKFQTHTDCALVFENKKTNKTLIYDCTFAQHKVKSTSKWDRPNAHLMVCLSLSVQQNGVESNKPPKIIPNFRHICHLKGDWVCWWLDLSSVFMWLIIFLLANFMNKNLIIVCWFHFQIFPFYWWCQFTHNNRILNGQILYLSQRIFINVFGFINVRPELTCIISILIKS